ncbi:MAG: hypothetical protein ACRC24_07990 [Vibrionaceae bacterium]
MSFPLEPITNSSAPLASNSTALSTTLPIIAVNSSQDALATIAPKASTAPTAEQPNGLATNFTTTLFQGYSSAASWSDVAMNTSPSVTQAGRRAQASRADEKQDSTAPLVRRRIRRNEATTSPVSEDNPTPPPPDEHIGKIMCGGTADAPKTKPDFTFANVFPKHRYNADEAVERCAELAFDPTYKDCADGVKKVCEALLKHLDVQNTFGDDKLSPAAWALMGFLQNVTENSFNHHVLLNSADKKIYTEKKDESDYFYFPPGNKNGYYENITGKEIKIISSKNQSDGVEIVNAIIKNVKLDNISLSSADLTLSTKEGDLQLNATSTKTQLELSDLRYEKQHLINKNGETIDDSDDLYQLFFETEKTLHNATAKIDQPVKVSNITAAGDVIESRLINVIVADTKKNKNFTIISGGASGELCGILQSGKIKNPGTVEKITISSSENLLKKDVTLDEISRDIGFELSIGEISNPERIILKDDFNITLGHSVVNKSNFTNQNNYTIAGNETTPINATDYLEVKVSGKLTIEGGYLNLEQNKISSININCKITNENKSENISTDANGDLSGNQGCLLIPKEPNGTQYHYILDQLKNVDIELGEKTKITDLQLALNKVHNIKEVNLNNVILSNATLIDGVFTADSLIGNKTISDGEKEFIRIRRPIKLDPISGLQKFNLTKDAEVKASDGAKKEAVDGRKAEALFRPKLRNILNKKTTWQPPQPQSSLFTDFFDFLYKNLHGYAKFTVFLIGATTGAAIALVVGGGITKAIYRKARRDELRAQIYYRNEMRELRATDTTEAGQQNAAAEFNPAKYVDEAISKKRDQQQAKVPCLEELLAAETARAAAGGQAGPEGEVTVEVPDTFITKLLAELQLRDWELIEQRDADSEAGVQADEEDLIEFDNPSDESKKKNPFKEKYLKRVEVRNENDELIKKVMVSVAVEAQPSPWKEWQSKLAKDFAAKVDSENTPESDLPIVAKSGDIELQRLVIPNTDWRQQFLQLSTANLANESSGVAESVVMADERNTDSSQTSGSTAAPADPAATSTSAASGATAPVSQRVAAGAGGAGDPNGDDPDPNKKQGEELKKQCEKDGLTPKTSADKKEKEVADFEVNAPEEEEEGAATQVEAEDPQVALPKYHEQFIQEICKLSDDLANTQKEIEEKKKELGRLQIERLKQQLAHYDQQGIIAPTNLTTTTSKQQQRHATAELLQQREIQEIKLNQELKLAEQKAQQLAQQEKIASCQNALVQGQYQGALAIRRANVASAAFAEGSMPPAAYNALLAGNHLTQAAINYSHLEKTSQIIFAANTQNETVPQRMARDQFTAVVTKFANSQLDATYLSNALALAEQLAPLKASCQMIRSACTLARQAEQNHEGVNAALAALTALQEVKVQLQPLPALLEQTDAQNSLSSKVRSMLRELCRQAASLDEMEQKLNAALPELTAMANALADPGAQDALARCVAGCDNFGKAGQEFAIAAEGELKERLVRASPQDQQAKRKMEQRWQLSATAGRYLGELQSHATQSKTLIPLFLANGHADAAGTVAKPFGDVQRQQLLEKITAEQQEFIRLVTQTSIEIAASYDPSIVDGNKLKQELGVLQNHSEEAKTALKKYHNALLTLELDEGRRANVYKDVSDAKKAFEDVTKLLDEAQKVQTQAKQTGSKNLKELTEVVAKWTEYRGKLEDDFTGAEEYVKRFEKRVIEVKNKLKQAKEEAAKAADYLIRSQQVLLQFLDQQRQQCYQSFLAAKQVLVCQPLLVDLSLKERQKLAKSTLSVIEQAVNDFKPCKEPGEALVEQLERLDQISQNTLFVEQCKQTLANVEQYTEQFGLDIDQVVKQKANIITSTQWPKKLFESISYSRLRASNELSSLEGLVQSYITIQEPRLSTLLAKLGSYKLALNEYVPLFNKADMFSSLIAMIDTVLSCEAIYKWKELEQSDRVQLSADWMDEYDKLNELMSSPEVKQDQALQCLLQGVRDELMKLLYYTESVTDGMPAYFVVAEKFDYSENRLRTVCLDLREQNPKLEPPDLAPIYYGRGIRDYFAAQRQQQLEQVQVRQASEQERVLDAALKLYGVYKMGAAAETKALLKWQTDDKDRLAAAAEKAPEPIATTLGRIDAILCWDNTKAANRELLQENRDALTKALTTALTGELQPLLEELEYRSLKHHQASKKAAAQAQTNQQQDIVEGRLKRLAQIPYELRALAQQINKDDEALKKAAKNSRAHHSPTDAVIAKRLSDNQKQKLFSALEQEETLLTGEQKEYESDLRCGKRSKADLDAPVSAYTAAMREQARRHLVGGGLSVAEKEQLVAELVKIVQPTLEQAASKGAVAKTARAQTDAYKITIPKVMRGAEDANDVQEYADMFVESVSENQRLKFTGKSGSLSQSLIEKSASQIAYVMAKRANLHVADKVLEPMTNAVVNTLQAALQQKYGQLLEEKAEQKVRTARVQAIKFKANECEKALVAQKPELALMAEQRYELEQERDAKAAALRQPLAVKVAKFDLELSQLQKEQQQYAAAGNANKSQKLLKRIAKMSTGRIDVEGQIQADRTIRKLNNEIGRITEAMEKRAFKIPALSLQEDAALRTQVLADELRGAAAAEEQTLAGLHAAADPDLVGARLYHELAQAIKDFDNVKIKIAKGDE